MGPTASESVVAENNCGAEYSDMNFDCMFKILLIGNSGVGKTSFLLQVSVAYISILLKATFDPLTILCFSVL